MLTARTYGGGVDLQWHKEATSDRVGSCRLPDCSQNRTLTSQEARPLQRPGLLTCYFRGVGEGTRTPGPQDHNLVL